VSPDKIPKTRQSFPALHRAEGRAKNDTELLLRVLAVFCP